jgi:molybdopterin-guanine dinucleotide biosynthesis protein A
MLTVAIQAGGKSSRMGEDKALKTFQGRPLIQRVIDRTKLISDEIIITTNHPREFAFLNLPLFTDIHPDRGALGGLHTALFSARFPAVAVVACDLPFVSPSLLQSAYELINKEEWDVVIPESGEGLEPLHALYRRDTCLPAINSAIAENKWKVISWFPQVRVKVLSPAEVEPFNHNGLVFWNLNTPEEFVQAEDRARQEDANE